MIKLKDLINEEINEIKNGRIGDYFMQKAGSDTVNYGVIVDELANGSFKVVMFSVRDGKVTGKAKTASTKGWYPEPKKISKDEVPDKVLSKIQQKSNKYESVNESSYSETYFDTFTAAVEYAEYAAEKKGYVIDKDDWFKQIGTGGGYTRSRPSVGKTHRFSVDLYKNGKKQRKALQIQVYGMASGGYELNTYIN